jgi:hypothetical protein
MPTPKVERQPVTIRLFGADMDVTEWQDRHPGGRKLLKIFHNRDATQQFLAIHKGDAASKMLKSMAQKPSEPTKEDTQSKYQAAEEEFDSLVKSLKPELCRVNPIYELAKITYILSFVSIGYILCFQGHKYIGLGMMCLSLYQAARMGRARLQPPIYTRISSGQQQSIRLLGLAAGLYGRLVEGKAQHSPHGDQRSWQ